jgi:hypothetical protein
MTVGQQFSQQGDLRIMFYDRVLKRADEVGSCLYLSTKLTDMRRCYLSWYKQNAERQKEDSVQRVSRIFSLSQFFCLLINFYTPWSIVEVKAVAQHLLQIINPDLADAGASVHPTVFLAFDAAHTISEAISTSGVQWSKLSALRHALKAIRLLPIWSIFLSAKALPVPAPFTRDGYRVSEGRLFTLMPFGALGFDLLATKFSFDGTVDIDHVASLKY